MTPYQENNGIRTFLSERDDSEYVWHRDDEDRCVKILEGEAWQLQFEDTLPYLLRPGQSFVIRKNEYHRLIKGIGDLTVQIVKL